MAYINEIKIKIRSFLSNQIDTKNLSDSDDMFKQGYVNSLFAMELVMFVENEFGITIENEDLKLDNFRTVDAISKFVINKQ